MDVRPRKNCPFCGSTNLRVKEWKSKGTYFVACQKCRAAGPSLARTPQEACELFDSRAELVEQLSLM